MVNNHTWDTVIDSLVSIPSALRQVIINAEFYGEPNQVVNHLIRCINWERLDEALEQHRGLEALVLDFVDVTRVRWRLEGEDLESAKRLFESHLVRTFTRGILRYRVD